MGGRAMGRGDVPAALSKGRPREVGGQKQEPGPAQMETEKWHLPPSVWGWGAGAEVNMA